MTEPLSKDSTRAVDVVFQSCRVTGAALSLCHTLAAKVAEELERIEASRLSPKAGDT
jgi:hypothetical protein